MRKNRLWGVLILAIWTLAAVAAPALAGETMDKIEKTGKIKIGFREDSIPFAFIDPKVGKQVGFSVDMANLLAEISPPTSARKSRSSR